jgi:hypothetical protein
MLFIRSKYALHMFYRSEERNLTIITDWREVALAFFRMTGASSVLDTWSPPSTSFGLGILHEQKSTVFSVCQTLNRVSTLLLSKVPNPRVHPVSTFTPSPCIGAVRVPICCIFSTRADEEERIARIFGHSNWFANRVKSYARV